MLSSTAGDAKGGDTEGHSDGIDSASSSSNGDGANIGDHGASGSEDETMGQPHHHDCPTETLPTRWNMAHLKLLNFTNVNLTERSIGIDVDRDIIRDVYCKWLFSDIEDLWKAATVDLDPDKVLADGFLAAAHGEACLRQRVGKEMQHYLDCKEDRFSVLLSEFVTHHSFLHHTRQKLLSGIHDFSKLKTKQDYNHVLTLWRWVEVCCEHGPGRIRDELFNDLLVAIVNSAGYESGCLVQAKVRKSSIQICGRSIQIQNHIEVHGIQDALLQIISLDEDVSDDQLSDSKQYIPQLVCHALATAMDSPFGNSYYKTMYQLALHGLSSPRVETKPVEMILSRVHVAISTVQSMSECPMAQSFKPSFIVHNKIRCGRVQSSSFVNALYRGCKAVFSLCKITDEPS
ncbi:uncharacterized protein [Ptychodera flava]|uniref:uncharacterized protein n=1 Tax=Ptychodera flava TaxID=63121 RepID=UPI00396A5477